jgi:hypothetical protein
MNKYEEAHMFNNAFTQAFLPFSQYRQDAIPVTAREGWGNEAGSILPLFAH